jgi:two-component system phosphate regulon sensor histidine kinase PhoR
MEHVGALAEETGEGLRQLFDDDEEARVLLNADRRMVLVNRACEAMFGRSRAELLGKSAAVLSPERFDAEYNGPFERLMTATAAKTVQVNMWGIRSSGEFPARVTARALGHPGQRRLMSLVIIDRSADDGPGRQLRDFLDAAAEGSLLVDENGVIVMSNARTQEMFQRSGPDLVGHRIEDLIPDAMRGGHVLLREVFTGVARQHVMGLGTRVVAQRGDGTLFPVRVVLSSLGTREGVLVSVAVTDLTDYERLLNETGQLKDQFLATVSHELRTPLTSILGSAELLEDGIARIEDADLRRQHAHLTDVITRAVHRELALVEDLLTMTSIDHGLVGTGSVRTDVQVLVESVVDAWRARARAVEVDLVTDVAGLSVFVSGSERWLWRALDCLLSNAVKFTPAGGTVTVRAGVHEDLARVEVSDTGPGIPDDEVDDVFGRLYRGTAAVRSQVQGAGLGLAIARSIAESHGGSLTLEQHSPSCTFRLTAPTSTR